MCIILYKEKGVKAKIDMDIMKTCWQANPDGAGFAIAQNGKLVLQKGFMKWSAFEKAFEKATARINIKDSAILVHFRITTHGGTFAENTHPFPLGKDTLTSPYYQNLDTVVAMNGICLSNADKGYAFNYGSNWKTACLTPTPSDTMDAIQNLFNPLYGNDNRFYTKPNFDKIIDWLGAKWVFMDRDGNITTYGNFVTENNWHYSNTSYKPYVPTVLTPYTCTTSQTDYDMLAEFEEGLIPFTGIINVNGEDITVALADDIYLDEDGNLWQYDWIKVDYTIVNGYVITEGDYIV